MDGAGVWTGAQVVWSNGSVSIGETNVVTALDRNGNAVLIGNRQPSTAHQLVPAYLPAAASAWQVMRSVRQ
jgi:hypothetical protein